MIIKRININTEAREKISTDLESLEFKKNFDLCLTIFENYLILLSKIRVLDEDIIIHEDFDYMVGFSLWEICIILKNLRTHLNIIICQRCQKQIVCN